MPMARPDLLPPPSPAPRVYVALHGSYLLWWFIHQRLSPTWGPTVFPKGNLPLPGIALVFLAVGPGGGAGARELLAAGR
jgi:hypothetical protein